MAAKIILHLSDLHFTTLNEGTAIEDAGSWLTTATDNTQLKNYADEFTRYVLMSFPDHEKYLVITGDIADMSAHEEYQAANTFLERVIQELKIDKSRILMIPGDHDVNRINAAYAAQQAGKPKNSFEFVEQKFSFFAGFYQGFLGKGFSLGKAIIDIMDFPDERILFIGMDSNQKVGSRSARGFIDTDQLKTELEQLLPGYPDHSKIAVFHHNIVGEYEKDPDGQWDADNKIALLRTLEKYEFKVVMYGNEHISVSKTSNQMVEIAVGSFGKKGSHPNFKAYEIITEGQLLSLKHHRYQCISDNAHQSYLFGNWSEVQPNAQYEFLELIELRKPAAEKKTLETFDIIQPQAKPLVTAEELIAVVDVKPDIAALQLNFKESDYHEKLFKIVKDLDLFKWGHFHWSDTSKAHNWIDVPMLLSKREHVFLAQKAIMDVIEKNALEADFILGLGIEGNIIGSYAALRLNKPYSFLPYSYRYHDHEAYEKKLSLTNGGKFKKILIITDVVNNGQTVDRLLAQEAEFFSQDHVQQINVVGLFYTGDPERRLLNPDPQKYIQFYYVSHLKVERCPYGEDFRETCMIYREKLSCVHEFYDADTVLKSS